jgi:acyl-homoserine lactone acylase PvdQ
MVVELGPEGAVGIHAIPVWHSSDPASEHSSDQAKLWLAHDTLVMSTEPSEIAANAVSRETFTAK